jgi:DTW domain-containing protein
VTKRSICERCLRPQSACICQWIAPVNQPVQVLILQHPDEVAQAKGSARLLHLSVQNSQMLAGEVFDPAFLSGLLHGGKQSVLLYPSSPQDAAQGVPPPPALAASALQTPEQLQLVVIDATWRKSRKMLYLNPALQALPRLALHNPPPSNYRIRRAHKPDQLSTLEATCAALGQLGAQPQQMAALLAAFDGFVEQQRATAACRTIQWHE